MKDQKICGNCAHQHGGICKRNPPVPVVRGAKVRWYQPAVEETDYCSEWSPAYLKGKPK